MKAWMMLAVYGILAVLGCQRQQTGQEKSGTDSAYYELSDSQVQCKISADIPELPVAQAVGEWLDEVLGGEYPGDVRELHSLVDFYGKAMTDTLRMSYGEMSTGAQLAYEAQMRKAYETDEVVTYTVNTYVYLGGPHPFSTAEGATFRKSDGRRLGWDIIRRGKQETFLSLVVQSLKKYLEVSSDKELEDMTNRSIYAIPLPKTPPYLLDGGVAFIYQQYELGSYAIGMPTDVIAYDRVTPLMAAWTVPLINPNK